MVKDFKISPLTISKEEQIHMEDSLGMNDEHFFYDRMKWMEEDFLRNEDIYKSKSKKDRDRILISDIESITILRNQIMRFGRIVMSTDKGTIYNFPNSDIPKFYTSNRNVNTIKTNMEKTK